MRKPTPLLRYPFVRAVVQANQFLGPQCSHGVCAPLVVAELDLGHGGGEQFNDGSNLAADKPLLGHILKHGYLGKKLHLPHTSLILKNIARNKPRSDLAASDDPATANVGSAFAAPQLKVDYVPGAVPIGSSGCGVFFQGRADQRCAKFFRMSSSHPQEGVKHTRLMPSARMPRTQAIVSKLLNLDNGCIAVR